MIRWVNSSVCYNCLPYLHTDTHKNRITVATLSDPTADGYGPTPKPCTPLPTDTAQHPNPIPHCRRIRPNTQTLYPTADGYGPTPKPYTPLPTDTGQHINPIPHCRRTRPSTQTLHRTADGYGPTPKPYTPLPTDTAQHPNPIAHCRRIRPNTQTLHRTADGYGPTPKPNRLHTLFSCFFSFFVCMLFFSLLPKN